MKLLSFIMLLCLGVMARGNSAWNVSNQISGVSEVQLYTNIVQGSYRVTLYSFDGTNEADLTSSSVRFLVEDPRDGKVTTGATIRLSAGIHRAESSLLAISEPYTLKFVAFNTADTNVAPLVIHWASITVTSAPSAGACPDVIVNNISTGPVRSVTKSNSNNWDEASGAVTLNTNLYVRFVNGESGDSISLTVRPGTNPVGTVYWDVNEIVYGTAQPRGESEGIPVQWAGNTALVDIARGYNFIVYMTGHTVIAYPTPRASTNHSSWGKIDIINYQTNWLDFDFTTIDSNSVTELDLDSTNSVLTLGYHGAAGTDPSVTKLVNFK